MREEESNWFSKWEEELPSPEDLIPMSQSLITPDLALAFNIPNPHHHAPPSHHHAPPQSTTAQPNSSAEFDSPDPTNTTTNTNTNSDEPARTLKRPRLVWTPQLHKRFVDAVAHLGIKNAVPKTIMQLMSVDGLTRENVASHLQKYRLYLKRMQGISNNGNTPPGNGNGNGGGMDPATDHLFASSPVPAHFLHQGARGSSEHFLPFVPVPVVGHHHHHHQMAVVAAPPPPPQFRQFDQHPFIRQTTRMANPVHVGGNGNVMAPVYVEDLEANGRKVLTLFPTGED